MATEVSSQHPASVECLLQILDDVHYGKKPLHTAKNGDVALPHEKTVHGQGGLEGYSAKFSVSQGRLHACLRECMNNIFHEKNGIPGTIRKSVSSGALQSREEADALWRRISQDLLRLTRYEGKRNGHFVTTVKNAFEPLREHLEHLDLPARIMDRQEGTRGAVGRALGNGEASQEGEKGSSEEKRGEEEGADGLWGDREYREILFTDNLDSIIHAALTRLRASLYATSSPVIGKKEEMDMNDFQLCEKFLQLAQECRRVAIVESRASTDLRQIKKRFIQKLARGLGDTMSPSGETRYHSGLVSALTETADSLMREVGCLTDASLKENTIAPAIEFNARVFLLPKTSAFLVRRGETETGEQWQWSDRDRNAFHKHFLSPHRENALPQVNEMRLQNAADLINHSLHAGLMDTKGQPVILLQEAKEQWEALCRQLSRQLLTQQEAPVSHAAIKEVDDPVQRVALEIVSQHGSLNRRIHDQIFEAVVRVFHGDRRARTRAEVREVAEAALRVLHPPLSQPGVEDSVMPELISTPPEALQQDEGQPEMLPDAGIPPAWIKVIAFQRARVEEILTQLPGQGTLEELQGEYESLDERIDCIHDVAWSTHALLVKDGRDILRRARMRKRATTLDDQFDGDVVCLQEFLEALRVHQRVHEDTCTLQNECESLHRKISDFGDRVMRASIFFTKTLLQSIGEVSPVELQLVEEDPMQKVSGIQVRMSGFALTIQHLLDDIADIPEFETEEEREQYQEDIQAALDAMNVLSKKVRGVGCVPTPGHVLNGIVPESNQVIVQQKKTSEKGEQSQDAGEESRLPGQELSEIERQMVFQHCLLILSAPREAGYKGTGMKVGKLRKFLRGVFPDVKLPQGENLGQKDDLFSLLKEHAEPLPNALRAWKEQERGMKQKELTNGTVYADGEALKTSKSALVLSLNDHRNFVFTLTHTGRTFLKEHGMALTPEQLEACKVVAEEVRSRYKKKV